MKKQINLQITKKGLFTSIFVTALLLFTGCSQKAPEATILENPQNPKEKIPKWVFGNSQNQAVGSALSSPHGFSHQKDEAVMMARAELASSMNSRVEQLVKNYYEKSRTSESIQRRALTSTTTRLITNMVLVNSYISDIWISKKNEMFVLVSIDNKEFNSKVQKALKDSSEDGFKDLDNQIKKVQSDVSVSKIEQNETIPIIKSKKRTLSKVSPAKVDRLDVIDSMTKLGSN